MERMDSLAAELEAYRKMTAEEQEEFLAPWRPYAPGEMKKIMLLRTAQMTEEEIADPKSHPLEAAPNNQKKGNETLVTNSTMSGGAFSEENFSKFVLRKKDYIIKDKQVTPPNPLPEPFAFSEETMSRSVLRRLGYTFTDEILPEAEAEAETGTIATRE